MQSKYSAAQHTNN